MPDIVPFHEGSPWAELNNEVKQGHGRRKDVIKRIAETLGGSLVTYFCSFHRSMIDNNDVEMLESVLLHEKPKKLFLLINAPGGDGLAAERIVNVCRSYAPEGFECIVPHMAKSAATVICFGADAIHMSPTSELGPVDPQVLYKNEQGETLPTSADELVRAYDKLFDAASSGKVAVIEPYLQQLQRFDARYIEQLRSAQALTEAIACRMASLSMMKGMNSKEIGEKLAVFIKQEGTKSHGRMLTASEASECGLKVKLIALASDLWRDIWTLYTRSSWLVAPHNGLSKVIESEHTSLNA